MGATAEVFSLALPRSRSLPGTPLRPPDSNNSSGTVAVTIDEKFFDSLLGTIFQKLGPPQLKLSQLQPQTPWQPAAFEAQCDNVVVLNPDADNVKTRGQFAGGKIIPPLAFTGTYPLLTQ